MSEPVKLTYARDGALLAVTGLGPASACVAYGQHRPRPLRFIWHHVLPQACGGQSIPANLVSLCDSCHYAVHALLSSLARHNGDKLAIAGIGATAQRQIAMRGYQAALAAGTVNKIPDEGGTLPG